MRSSIPILLCALLCGCTESTVINQYSQTASTETPGLVDFSIADNLVPDPKYMELDSAHWVKIPSVSEVALPYYPTILSSYGGYTSYKGYVHRSTVTSVSSAAYDWAESSMFEIDPRKAYRFSIWIYSEAADINNYLGFYVFDSAGNRITGLWDNPYFKVSEGDAAEWVEVVGCILPANSDADGSGHPDIPANPDSTYVEWAWPLNGRMLQYDMAEHIAQMSGK